MKKARSLLLLGVMSLVLSSAGTVAAHARPTEPPVAPWRTAWRDAPISSSSAPGSVHVAQSGMVWFADVAVGAGYVVSFDPSTGTVTPYPSVTPEFPFSVTTTPDGMVWYIDVFSNSITRLDPAGGSLSSFPLPTRIQPVRLEVDSDGGIWAATRTPGMIAHIGPDGTLSLIDIGGTRGQPEDVAWGDDGRLWVVQSGRTVIDAFDPVSGVTTSYPVSAAGFSVDAGADGFVYVMSIDKVLKISPAGVEDVLSVPAFDAAAPTVIRDSVAGPKGIYLALQGGNIVALSPDGSFVDLGAGGDDPQPDSVSVAPDGYIWYTDIARDSLVYG